MARQAALGAGAKSVKLLLVCLGNICRSPMAEGVFRHLVRERGLNWQIDSAGTADYHVGEAPDPRACQASSDAGIDISALRARQVEARDFLRFDWILALDAGNLRALQAQANSDASAQIGLLLDPFLEGKQNSEVADPYWGDLADFQRCLVQIQHAAEDVIARIS